MTNPCLGSWVLCRSASGKITPGRAVRRMTDTALQGLSPLFSELYSQRRGRPSIAPKYLLRVLVLHILYAVSSKRRLS